MKKQGIWISGPTSESRRGKKHDSTYHWIDFEDYRNNSSGDSWNPATCDRCPSLCTAEVRTACRVSGEAGRCGGEA